MQCPELNSFIASNIVAPDTASPTEVRPLARAAHFRKQLISTVKKGLETETKFKLTLDTMATEWDEYEAEVEEGWKGNLRRLVGRRGRAMKGPTSSKLDR